MIFIRGKSAPFRRALQSLAVSLEVRKEPFALAVVQTSQFRVAVGGAVI